MTVRMLELAFCTRITWRPSVRNCFQIRIFNLWFLSCIQSFDIQPLMVSLLLFQCLKKKIVLQDITWRGTPRKSPTICSRARSAGSLSTPRPESSYRNANNRFLQLLRFPRCILEMSSWLSSSIDVRLEWLEIILLSFQLSLSILLLGAIQWGPIRSFSVQ